MAKKAKKSDVPIPGFDSYYASSNGEILSARQGALRRMRVSPQRRSGHVNVKLRRNGKTVTRWVHRLILETFVGRCPTGCECRHMDGDPSNNRLGNLRWDSLSENRRDRNRHGDWNHGEHHPMAKLTDGQVDSIRRRYRNGETQRSIAASFGINQGYVSSLVNEKNRCKRS